MANWNILLSYLSGNTYGNSPPLIFSQTVYVPYDPNAVINQLAQRQSPIASLLRQFQPSSSQNPGPPQQLFQNSSSGESPQQQPQPQPSHIFQPSQTSQTHDMRPTLLLLRLQTEVNVQASDSEDTCSICRETFSRGNVLRKIRPCHHQFHQQCIDQWFEAHITCPHCRIDIRTGVENQERVINESVTVSSDQDVHSVLV